MNLQVYRNTFVRKGNNCDRKMVKESYDNYSHFDLNENDIVLDLGANIGGFVNLCAEANVKKYIGYEPDNENFKVLSENVKKLKNFEIIRSAVSARPEKELVFLQTSSGNKDCSGSICRKPRKNLIEQVVPNTTFDEVFESVRPSIVKMDIEGAEYEWFLNNKGVLPDYIRQISFEIHSEKMFSFMEKVCIFNLRKDFDLIHINPNAGFIKENSPVRSYPNIGFEVKCGTLFGIDLLFKRKIS